MLAASFTCPCTNADAPMRRDSLRSGDQGGTDGAGTAKQKKTGCSLSYIYANALWPARARAHTHTQTRAHTRTLYARQHYKRPRTVCRNKGLKAPAR